MAASEFGERNIRWTCYDFVGCGRARAVRFGSHQRAANFQVVSHRRRFDAAGQTQKLFRIREKRILGVRTRRTSGAT